MTEFIPTEEQVTAKDLALENDYLKIEAIAGSGKTSSLVYIASHINKPSMYIAFNKAMAEEAKQKFPPHVECKTMHSLAYRHVGHKYVNKLNRPSGKYVNVAFTGNEIANYFRVKDYTIDDDNYVSKAYIGLIAKDTVSKFECSSDDKLTKDSVPNFHIKSLTKKHKNLNKTKFINVVLKVAKSLWKERIDRNSDVLCTHDTYLKLYQLSKPQIDNIEVLYLDEMQDSSDCFLDIVNNQNNTKRILVGDSRQAIYQWRGAIDAMKKVKCKSTQLSKSFRYGDEVAKVARNILDNEIEITGNENLNTKAGSNVVNFNEKHTYIFRTNTALIFKAVDLISAGESVNVNIDVRDFVNTIKSAEALYSGDLKNVKHEDIVPYKTWGEFSEDARTIVEFNRVKQMVEDGDSAEIINTLHKHKNSKDALITLTTAHRSKGLEYKQVVLYDDFPSIYNSKGEYIGLRYEEQNLLYVAATRALKALQVNETIKEIMDKCNNKIGVNVSMITDDINVVKNRLKHTKAEHAMDTVNAAIDEYFDVEMLNEDRDENYYSGISEYDYQNECYSERSVDEELSKEETYFRLI